MSWANKTEYLWWPRRVSNVPTIAVSDLHADEQKARDEKVKAGATVVPFGFGRALSTPAPTPAPQFVAWDELP